MSFNHEISRRDAVRLAAAGCVAASLPGCESKPPQNPVPVAPPPTLGWETIASGTDGPGPRSRHELVYDAREKTAILFGGLVWRPKPIRLLSDTWELRDRQWNRVNTVLRPPARYRGAMVYLVYNGFSMLFGGWGAKNELFGDTWIYSSGQWQQAQPRGASPTPRGGHSLAYDELSGLAVLFGGVDANDQPFGDTWLFNSDGWERLDGPSPPSRRYAAFAFDPDLKGCLLHGGSEDDHSVKTFSDAWLFHDRKWQRLPKEFEASPRDDHGLTYHRTAKRMVMLEGVKAERGVLVREANGWRKIDVNPIHPRHQCSPLVWDESLGGILMHGGEVNHGGPQFDATLLLHMPALL